VRVEKWKLKAARAAGINVSEVLRKALDLALAAKSKRVRSKDVLEDERLAEEVKKEFQQMIEEKEREREQRLKESEELLRRLLHEKEHRRQAERALMVRRAKKWLEEHEEVAREARERLLAGEDIREVQDWLLYERGAVVPLDDSFREVVKWLLEQ